MSRYKVTVTVRAVMNVDSDGDANAGNAAIDYVEHLLRAGQDATHAPDEVTEAKLDTRVQAVTRDDSPVGPRS
jgi:hypothetical protein